MIGDYIDSVETSENERIVKFSKEILSTSPRKKNIFDAIFYDFEEINRLTLDFSSTQYLNSMGVSLVLDAMRTLGQPDKIQKELILIIDSRWKVYSMLKPVLLSLANKLELQSFTLKDKKEY